MAVKTINQFTEDSSPTSDDYILVWDTTTGATKKVLLSKASDLIESIVSPAWQSWTPTLTNISGGTATAKYLQIGKTVWFRFRYVFAGAGLSGNPNFSLPVAVAAGMGSEDIIGSAILGDFGNNVYLGTAVVTTNAVLVRGISTSGSILNLTSSVPFTWGNQDSLSVFGFYEAA